MRSGSAGEWSISGDMTGQTWIDTEIFALSFRLVSNLLFATEKEYYHDNFVNTVETSDRCLSCVTAYLVEKKNNFFPLD